MLTVTRQISRARIAAGLAGLGALTLVGLGLTASGTQAAERLRSHVEDTIGVDLADLDVMPPALPAQAAPAAPPAPAPEPAEAALPAPAPEPAPAALPAPAAPREVIAQDARSRHYAPPPPPVAVRPPEVPPVPDLAELDRTLAALPMVKSANCGGGGHGELVIHGHEGPRQTVVICNDRIQAQTANAVAMAERSKALGLATARVSLNHARAAIAANTALSDEQRADALEGIDQAISELDHSGRDED